MKAIIVQPHQNNAIIGMGGTILKLLKAGWEISFVYMTDGRHGSLTIPPEKLKETRAKEARMERELLGIKTFYAFDIEDGKLGSLTESEKAATIQKLAELVKESDVVFMPSAGEAHADYKATHQLVSEAVKQKDDILKVQYTVWLFPLYNHKHTALSAILKVGVDAEFDMKLKLMRLHQSQVESGRYDMMAETIQRYFSLIYSEYKNQPQKYAEILGVQNKVSHYEDLLSALKDVEDVTSVFHGREEEKIKA